MDIQVRLGIQTFSMEEALTTSHHLKAAMSDLTGERSTCVILSPIFNDANAFSLERVESSGSVCCKLCSQNFP